MGFLDRFFKNKRAPTPVGNEPVLETINFIVLPKAPDKWGLPESTYRKCHKEINQAISDFNAATTPDAKKKALQNMQAAIEFVDVRVQPSVLAKAARFDQIKKDLFPQIKAAYAEYGVKTMLKGGNEISPVARIVSDMSPAKAGQLMSILHKGPSNGLNKRLHNLYSAEDVSAEAEEWRGFIHTHTVAFLGGGNSKNFKVTNTHDGSTKILKVDNRLDMPRHVEQHLRNKLTGVFTPIHADRQVIGQDPRKPGTVVSRTLLVTDFCTGGSLHEHSQAVGKMQNPNDTYSGASHMMGQMAQVLMDIQNANCCFPDAKITNWLVDSNGKILLADTKSFLFTDNGEYRVEMDGNQGTKRIATPGFIQNEIFSDSFNAEAIHASILGRNIYVYLNFEKNIFHSALGAEYKALIEALIVDPARNRMDLKSAQSALVDLGIKAQYESLKKGFESFSMGKNDLEMKKYLDDCDRATILNGKPDIELMKAQIKSMNTMLDGLKESKETAEVKAIVNEFDKQSRWNPIGMGQKARRIEDAMAKVPIEERVNLLQSKHSAVSDVLKAIASHRISFIDPLNQDKKISPEKAASSFTAFKEKFKTQINLRQDVVQEQDVKMQAPKMK